MYLRRGFGWKVWVLEQEVMPLLLMMVGEADAVVLCRCVDPALYIVDHSVYVIGASLLL